MAADPTLLAETRTRPGTAESRRLRAKGIVPGIVYGHGEGSVGIAVPAHDLRPILVSGHQVVDLKLDGNVQKSIFKAVQYDTFGQHILHFDLQRVSADEKLETDVRVVTTGIAPGSEAGGVLQHDLDSIHIRCSAVSIPDRIEVSVSELQVGDEIRVGDIVPPEGVEILTDPHDLVAHVIDAEALAARQEAAVEAATVDSLEPELVGEGDEDAPAAEDDDAPAKPEED
ncbi:50S ribosomal protein L25 [Alienimonas californiensis]|uniref:Large ribosomal subunit protein bL25 n=1 Tax=Alienimonas californiensis TaxID=2527989 RepID=A0A517PF65_9PLAN|nr:50S ribosomal protein L25 [Alienimonas californiensis]QDT18012.1 50S ribosomal protein L25 [Alienimonas californiensis]